MALNKNHEFEELNGVKCGIVERNVTPQRVQFLTQLLQTNGYTVVTVPSPPPKAAAPKPEAENTGTAAESTIATASETFTLGVTDYTFNWVNAIFGRQLKTKAGDIVTLAYWQQQNAVNNDELPYYEKE